MNDRTVIALGAASFVLPLPLLLVVCTQIGIIDGALFLELKTTALYQASRAAWLAAHVWCFGAAARLAVRRRRGVAFGKVQLTMLAIGSAALGLGDYACYVASRPRPWTGCFFF